MEQKVYLTLINGGNRFSENVFVRGKILGWAEIICDLYGGTKEKIGPDGKNHVVHQYKGGWWHTKDESLM